MFTELRLLLEKIPPTEALLKKKDKIYENEKIFHSFKIQNRWILHKPRYLITSFLKPTNELQSQGN